MNNQSALLKKIAILAAIAFAGLIAWWIYDISVFRLVKVIPSQSTSLARNQAIELDFSQEISNADEIVLGLKNNPADLVSVRVDKKKIFITPIAAYKPNLEYTFTLPVIKSKSNQSLSNTEVKFKTNDKINDQEMSSADIEDFTFKKYPFLNDLINSSNTDMTVTYGYPNDVFTLYVDIQPYVEPNLRSNQLVMDAKILETYRAFEATLVKYQTKPGDLKVEYTPDSTKASLKRSGIIK